MLPANALKGVTVIDLTRLLPGPQATQWFADMGATVIKIEDCAAGDYMRSIQPTAFEMINRGKQFLSLDLKSNAGRAQFLEMAATADVVIEGFRPGVMDRLGCGWDQLRQINPRLVYVALTGYGSGNAYTHLAGHDINYLAMAGVLDLIGPAGGPPSIPGVQIADIAGGSMQAVMATLAALMARHQTGMGQLVEVSMTHGSAMLLTLALAQARDGKAPQRGADTLSGRFACYNVYLAKDGRYLAVGALEAKFWAVLCTALEVPQFIDDQFSADPRRSEIIAAVQAVFLTDTAENWFLRLKHLDACVTPVRTVAEAAADLHL